MCRIRATLLSLALALVVSFGVLGVSSPAAAADSVLQVVAVRVNPGQEANYLGKVKQLNGIISRLGLKTTVRVWRATAAGENTGTVVVALEHPNLAAYADASTKMQGDSEWQKIIGSLDSIRTMLSTSLYDEITP